MNAIVRIQQKWNATYFKFDNQIDAINFATECQLHLMPLYDDENKVVYSSVSVHLVDDINDIEK